MDKTMLSYFSQVFLFEIDSCSFGDNRGQNAPFGGPHPLMTLRSLGQMTQSQQKIK